MLFRETVAVYCENHMEHTDTLCGQNAEFWYVKRVVHIVTVSLKSIILCNRMSCRWVEVHPRFWEIYFIHFASQIVNQVTILLFKITAVRTSKPSFWLLARRCTFYGLVIINDHLTYVWLSNNTVTRRLKFRFGDVHYYATTSQSAGWIRCGRC
jgi:hypothetical protein